MMEEMRKVDEDAAQYQFVFLSEQCYVRRLDHGL